MTVHIVLTLLLFLAGAALTASGVDAAPARGPLRVCPDNPRYFATPDGRAVYLTGAHTWNNLQDMGPTSPPVPFDWKGYLRFLERHDHNFVRLWRWELSRYGRLAVPEEARFCAPHPWARTGPGVALDGKPKFDLTRFDPVYFRRLRERIAAAGRRGIYVSVMLFEGWGLQFSPDGWQGHPFHPDNNINGVNADSNGDGRGLEFHTLADPAVTRMQENYVRRVIETLNPLDNVLFEISNENHPPSTEWQYHMIRFIHHLETDLPKRHPVGMTFQYEGGSNTALFGSPAEWVSPNPEGGYTESPPANDGRKVILSDTDHLWGLGGDPAWVWKSFARGLNPIFMDPYIEAPATAPDPKWDPLRRNLGLARRYALRMDLNRTRPAGELASSGYCLAVPDQACLVYVPSGGGVRVDLSAARGEWISEWLNLSSGKAAAGPPVSAGAAREFTAPFTGDAVLFLSKPTPQRYQQSIR